MKRVIIFLITLYRNLCSNNMLYYCRFYPTCSQYAIESIEEKGIIKGLFFLVFRILRCNPFSRGGFDPVNPVRDKLPLGERG
ncbi:MAG: membrane protein insertion efficiency factor YidD [Candidatus Omnitrophica bacterium]|nr:membrane protein insertion efficiency factor YidD [Candidatus Omnitrophota bacterium]